jgi:hypothetical protein
VILAKLAPTNDPTGGLDGVDFHILRRRSIVSKCPHKRPRQIQVTLLAKTLPDFLVDSVATAAGNTHKN